MAKANMLKLQETLNADSIKRQFQNSLNENAGAFVASIIDLYGSDTYLQQCDPNEVVMECLKAATLKLPINKQLGFAYVVPYRDKNGVQHPQFQVGYKGYNQLAMRTGQYRFLNSGVVCEGIKVRRNLLTGELAFEGEPTSDKAQGYFTYMELLNGFSKALYMTCAEVQAHAKRYSKGSGKNTSAWQTNFDEMAMKTTARLLLSKYGIMSTEMVTALTAEPEPTEDTVAAEIAASANGEIIDVEFTSDDSDQDAGSGQPPVADEQKVSDKGKGKAGQQKLNLEPGF